MDSEDGSILGMFKSLLLFEDRFFVDVVLLLLRLDLGVLMVVVEGSLTVLGTGTR